MKNNQYYLLLFSNNKHHIFSNSDNIFLKVLEIKDILKINEVYLSKNKKSIVINEFYSEKTLLKFISSLDKSMQLHIWIAIYFQSDKEIVFSKQFFTNFYLKQFTFEFDIYDYFTIKNQANKKPILELAVYSNGRKVYEKLTYAYNLGSFLLREIKIFSEKIYSSQISIEVSFQARPSTPYVIFDKYMLEKLTQGLSKFSDYSISISPK